MTDRNVLDPGDPEELDMSGADLFAEHKGDWEQFGHNDLRVSDEQRCELDDDRSWVTDPGWKP